MKRYIIRIILIQFLFPAFFVTVAQIYKVEYKSLSTKIFSGKTPTICILEEDTAQVKLFEGLAKLTDFKIKFNCYSTENLKENKEELNIEEFNPEDKKFLQSLNKQLSIEYLLTWKTLLDSAGVFELMIFSTKNYKKLYNNKFYYTINSKPILDVNKLLVENLKPVYFIITGEIQVNSKPGETWFKLFKGDELIKEWIGKEKIVIEEGKYKLITEADGYIKDEREIELLRDQQLTIEINLSKDLSILPKIYSVDNYAADIILKLEEEQLKISYDLAGDKEDKFEVKLSLIDKSTQESIEIKAVSGDIGKDILAGSNKFIVWQYLKELSKYYNLRNYDLQISAEKSGGIAWYYYVGGVVLVGGTTALLLNKNKESETPKTKIGEPPARP